MDIEFWVSLVKTPEKNEFLKENCTHVTGEYWIYEGENEFLEDELSSYKVIGEGAVPSLGDLSETELIEGCKEWFVVDID